MARHGLLYFLSFLLIFAGLPALSAKAATSTEQGWIFAGEPGFSGAATGDTEVDHRTYPGVYVDNGTVYSSYPDFNNENKLTVKKLDASTGDWQLVGEEAFTPKEAYYPALFVENGVPYVAFQDSDHNKKVTVMRLNVVSEQWEVVGDPGFTSGAGFFTSLVIDNGTPYIAVEENNMASVMKFSAGKWDYVGSKGGVSAGDAQFTSLDIDDGIPYVAYLDLAVSGNYGTSVKKYNESTNQWDQVGDEPFHKGYTYSVSMDVYQGEPYVAFYDQFKGYQVSVMNYDAGLNKWASVGGDDTALGTAFSVSLKVDAGIPYVAYQQGTDSKATLMKFDADSTQWAPVGKTGFTEGKGMVPQLFVDQGECYVAYKDDNYLLSVMKYVPEEPAKSDASKNEFQASPPVTAVGGVITLTAAGDLQFAAGELVGDERYVPTSWESEEASQNGVFTLSGGFYTSLYTPNETGKYAVTVTFQKQTWDGSAWVNEDGQVDTKTLSIGVFAAGGTIPTNGGARGIAYHQGYIYTAHRDSQQVTRTFLPDGSITQVLDGAGGYYPFMSVAVNGDGDLFYTVDSDKNIYRIVNFSDASLPIDVSTAVAEGKAEVYAAPGYNYLYAMAFDANDDLYFYSAEYEHKGIYKWTSESAEEVVDGLNFDVGGLAFSPAGDLFVTDSGNHDLYRIAKAELDRADGDSKLTNIANMGDWASGIAFLPDGHLIYSNGTNQLKYYHIQASKEGNSAGASQTDIAKGDAVTLTAAGDRDSKEGLLTGDERYIPAGWSSTESGQSGTFNYTDGEYVSTYTPTASGSYTVTITFQKQSWDGFHWVDVSGETDERTVVIRVTTGSSLWSKLDNGLDVLGGIDSASYAAVDGEGNVYVADTKHNRILKWSVSDEGPGTWSELVLDSSNGLGTFDTPKGIAVDREGNIYVADYRNDRVLKWNVAGADAGQWSELRSDLEDGQGKLTGPYGLVVDLKGTVYITSSGYSGVLKLEAGSSTWTAITASGGPQGANGLAVDGDGNLYAADTVSGRILKLTIDDNGIGAWSEIGYGKGNDLGQFQYPNGVAVDTNRNVYVADSVNDRIQKWTPATNTWSKWDDAGTSLGAFNKPTGVVVDRSGNVYIVDNVNNRVLKMTPEIHYPDTPTNIVAEAGDGQATVSFTTPVNLGGSPISEYVVTAYPGGLQVRGASSPITVAGLTNGTTYKFKVAAVNTAGQSAWSEPSSAVTPAAIQDPTDSSGGDDESPDSEDERDTDSGETSVIVLVNGKQESAGKAAASERNGQKMITITIDQQKLADKLATEGVGAVVTVPVTAGPEVVVGELNGQMVKNMENKQAVLEIRTDRAAYTLPARQINIDAVSDQFGKTIALEDIKVQIEIAAPTDDVVKTVENAAEKGTFSLVVPPVEFTVHAVYGDQTVEVAQFNNYVERTIAIPDGVDPNKITTGVVVDPDGTVRHVPTKVVVIDGKYYAKINSLTNSAYSVVWHPLAFGDMAEHWAKDAVNDMGSRMVISGTGDDLFGPDLDITRAEFAAIIVRGLGLKLADDASFFPDIPAAAWYHGAVNAAAQYGLISGFEDGKFRPNERITREQAMTIIAKAMTLTGLANKLSSQSADATLSAFVDAATTSSWARAAVAANVQAGIVSGRYGNALAPQSYITRAEVAVIVQLLLKKSELI